MKQCLAISKHRIEFLNSGPVGKHVNSFIDFLIKQGFSADYIPKRLGIIADLNRWLMGNELEISQLNPKNILTFMSDYRCRFESADRGVHKTSLNLFLNLLREKRIIKKHKVLTTPKEKDKVSFEFDEYLNKQKGLSHNTRIYYKRYLEMFLLETFEHRKINLKKLKTKNVLDFILKISESLPPKQMQLVTTTLRSFFQYARLTGKIKIDFSSSIPAIADKNGERIPESLTREEINKLLMACDRDDPIGMRDYAILLLLSRFGLRASEIIKLTLDDVNWERSTIVVQRKGGKQDLLPMDRDIGKAIVSYLKYGRPVCSHRQLFLAALAPLRGLGSPSTLSTIVKTALERAGLNPKHKGAHLLRHTVATQILRKGATLSEVGTILGHRSLQTTAIYSKVDFNKLNILAQPWPCNINGGGV